MITDGGYTAALTAQRYYVNSVNTVRIMIINAIDTKADRYKVREIDLNYTMFIGNHEECKQFQIDYNKNAKP